jgi:Zn-dependent M16 (insulinase) family peptidase
VYLDHILFPTITDAAFHTEVHHINGNGEDSGVVYCEMQGRQNSADDMIHFKLLQLIYPEESGYRSETGGRLENLRSLTCETVRQYHTEYYKPNNLAVIIAGTLESEEELKRAMKPVLESLSKKNPGKRERFEDLVLII